MIQVNSTLHTLNGFTIATGAVLDVHPFIKATRVYDENGVYQGVRYDLAYNVDIWKSLADYQKDSDGKGNTKLYSGEIEEFNTSFIVENVGLLDMTNPDQLLLPLQSHIENGDSQYSGVGVGRTAIIYPTGI